MIADIKVAQNEFAELVQRAALGEEVIIAKEGKPVVKMVACSIPNAPRRGGQWKGQVWMADDFDELPEDIAAAFRGEGD